jgi:hypothetical protein
MTEFVRTPCPIIMTYEGPQDMTPKYQWCAQFFKPYFVIVRDAQGNKVGEKQEYKPDLAMLFYGTTEEAVHAAATLWWSKHQDEREAVEKNRVSATARLAQHKLKKVAT